jgi:hypothetical protein
MWSDLRFALRMWRRQLGPAATIVVSVALGIAAVSTQHVGVHRVLSVNPDILPYPMPYSAGTNGTSYPTQPAEVETLPHRPLAWSRAARTVSRRIECEVPRKTMASLRLESPSRQFVLGKECNQCV